MTGLSFASDSLRWLRLPPCPVPSRCPYCPIDATPHWTHWGYYQRYAGDPEDPSKRVDIARYRCAIVKRTFSLLPDALLPYWGVRAGCILEWLHALFVAGVGVNTLARRVSVARGTLRYLKAHFLLTLPKLRLPRHEGAFKAPAFLTTLAHVQTAVVVGLFRDWKELEPKLSVMGVYVR